MHRMALPFPPFPFFIAFAVALVLVGCGDNVPDRAEYALVFEENFDGAALDAAKWTAAVGEGQRADAVRVRGGALLLRPSATADRAPVAAVHSAGKFAFRYGRVEVGARLPLGAGSTAYARLSPAADAYGPWPLSGEIGVVESFVDASGAIGESAVRGITRYGLPTPPSHGAAAAYEVAAPNAALVEYALEWQPGELRFFVDGDHVQTQTASEWFTYYPAAADGMYDPLGAYRRARLGAPFDQAFHIVLGVDAQAGATPPAAMEVDYVRVYECAGNVIRCGSRDSAVPALADNAGGPLANANTGRPFREELELYADGPAAVAAPTAGGGQTRSALVAGFEKDERAVVVSEPRAAHANDAANTAWRVSVAGGAAEFHLAAQDVSDGTALATGFDFSGHRKPGLGGEPVGEIAFDMRVQRLGDDAAISAGFSSGYPGERRFALPRAALAVGAWKTYSVKFADLLAAPEDGCCGLHPARVVQPFVLRVRGDAELLLDNIRATNACKVVDACGVDSAAVADPGRACAAPGTTLRFGFYAFFAPVSHSAVQDPDSPQFRTHRGYEADLLTALEALDGAELSFSRHPIDYWTGIWLQSATPRFDVVGGGITILESRTRNAAGEVVVRFTDGHIAFRQSLLVRTEDAERFATHAMLTSAARVGVLADTTGEARLLQLTALADADGVLAAGTRIETPNGTVTADGTDAYRITSAATTANVVGRTRLLPPDDAGPTVVYLGYERGEGELLDALRSRAIDAVARGEIGNSDAAAAADGRFVVTALDPQSEFGGFTVAADNPALLQCLNDKIRWLTNGGRIGYAQWRQDPTVFQQRAERWRGF